jgi:phenylacetyl-CoA:acceptor oxidoreductase 26-kDa subunit
MSYGPRPWQQRHWDWRAAANFMFGGAGAGLTIAAFVTQNLSPEPMLVALLLVAGGLGSVWLEIGRKLRAIHVFFNPFTSWMTREAFAATLLFAFGAIELFLPSQLILAGAALAACAFLYCQARILRAAKGIPAWRAPQVSALIMTTGLAEGIGLSMIMHPDLLVLSLFTAAAIARGFAWSGYWSALRQPSSRAVLASPGKVLIQIGTIVPLALVFGWIFVPQAAMLAAIAAILTGWRLKYVLVTRAALNQGFALPHLPVRGVR